MKKTTACLAILAALTAAASAPATSLPSSATVRSEILDGPEGTWVLATVSSRYGFPIQGQLDIVVNGTLFKSDPISTSTEVTRVYRVMQPEGVNAACGLFLGYAAPYGDLVQPVDVSHCSYLPVTSPVVPGALDPIAPIAGPRPAPSPRRTPLLAASRSPRAR